jgi:hypothetical protein
MSAEVGLQSAILARQDAERAHRTRLFLAWLAALAIVLVIAGYGYDYYTLGAADRPFSPKHDALRPSGTIGIRLGMFGVFLFFLIYLYPLRKKWNWLGRQGSTRHWLDFHIILGTLAPLVVAFHAAFKFANVAGLAFWSMLAVTLSGFVGRYIYSQIPRQLNSAELSAAEAKSLEESFRQELAKESAVANFGSIFQLPSPQEVKSLPALVVLTRMIAIDLSRPFRISLLRLQTAGFGSWLAAGCGLFRTRDETLERAIAVARKQASLSKRILFLSRTQQVFRMWHLVHRPFSYAFVVFALIHIGVALYMGYRL